MTLSGSPFDYLVAFSSGVFLSLTPCVYPLIPIVAGYIGANSGGSKVKGFTLSLAYVTGLAITYSTLGLLASLSGRVFGAINSGPMAHIFAGLAIIAFGLYMLGLLKMHMPNFIKAPSIKKQGHFPALVLGLTSGLMVSPCVTPVLGAILVVLAAKKNILYGSTLLFSFAYGMGMLLILVGTFSSVIISLPKSGKWMHGIKNFCAAILITMGLYFILRGIGRI